MLYNIQGICLRVALNLIQVIGSSKRRLMAGKENNKSTKKTNFACLADKSVKGLTPHPPRFRDSIDVMQLSYSKNIYMFLERKCSKMNHLKICFCRVHDMFDVPLHVDLQHRRHRYDGAYR